MMYMGSIYSAIGGFMELPNLQYIKKTLQQDAIHFTKFDSLRQIPWVIRPLYGLMSDNFFPFGYRIKIYMALCAILHITLCIYVAVWQPKFEKFTLAVIGINICISIIDALSEGISSIVTKLDANISKLETRLRENERDKTEIQAVLSDGQKAAQ